jgi:hypothetical protein
MSTATASKAARRQIAQDFKERKVPQGIFAVRCAATGEAWVGSSPNLAAAQNSLWFQLRGGRYRNSALQSAWQQRGEAAFTLEVVEQFADDTSPLLVNDLFTAKKREWAQTLGANLL